MGLLRPGKNLVTYYTSKKLLIGPEKIHSFHPPRRASIGRPPRAPQVINTTDAAL